MPKPSSSSSSSSSTSSSSELSVCFLVCSGTAANDLAIRLAQAHTGKKDMIVMEGGYHGNSIATIELSPYKFDGTGGEGASPHIHKTPSPDGYRGPFFYSDPQASQKYAAQVEQTIQQIQQIEKDEERKTEGDPESQENPRRKRRGLAGWIGEAVGGCGGQQTRPPEFLPRIFRAVRRAGGVSIVDEVQTGFGRSGVCPWAFQTQLVPQQKHKQSPTDDGAVDYPLDNFNLSVFNSWAGKDVEEEDSEGWEGELPDIVTLGKPIGNGHAIGAVVTTRAIAESFARTGMEFFSTFAGNAVACAAGLTVLDVLQEEDLTGMACLVSEYLMVELRKLQLQKPQLIGDVRGIGMFLGIELVYYDDNHPYVEGSDGRPGQPAAAEASYVVERMKEQWGILLSTDGPHHNVVKFKPPLVWNLGHAKYFLRAFASVLNEDPLQ
jgi:ethanolamine-phosphate phospho-lyase